MLGKKARDKVSGLEGIVTSMTTYINGCVRVVLQPPVDKDGKHVDSIAFDQEQIEVIGEGVKPKIAHGEPSYSGGDRPGVADRSIPTR